MEDVDRTTMGVGARELARDWEGSPYMFSRNMVADMTWASLGSEAAIVACRLAFVDGSSMLCEIDRKSTSSASCVRPRWLRDPRMVWLFSLLADVQSHLGRSYYLSRTCDSKCS